MPSPSLRTALLFLMLLALPACGVSFRSEFNGTEVFKSIAVSGDKVVGSEMTLTVEVAQPYPVPLQVTCYYEDSDTLTDDQKMVAFQERALVAGQTVLPPNTNSNPQDKAEKQKLSFKFTPTEAGAYFAACVTPAAAENGYGISFKVAKGP